MNDPNKRQVGGEHYNGVEFQHWDWMAFLFGPAHFICAITKYLTRWQKKGGSQDVEKAMHYHEKLLSLYERGKIQFVERNFSSAHLNRYCQENKVGDDEKTIFIALLRYRNRAELEAVGPLFEVLLRKSATSIVACDHGYYNRGNCGVCRMVKPPAV